MILNSNASKNDNRYLDIVLIVFFTLFFDFSTIQAKQSTHFIIKGDAMVLVDPDTHQEFPLSVSTAIVTAHEGVLSVNKKKLRLPLIIIKSTTGKTLRCNNKDMSNSIIIAYMRDGTCSCTPYTAQKISQKESSCVVKVLLDEQSKKSAQWCISSKKKIIITNPHAKNVNIVVPGLKLIIEVKNGMIYIDKKRYRGLSCMISSEDNHITINNTEYHGSLFITLYKDTCLIINYVPLEEYLFSVLKSESWPGWPLEVNKALAITSRSYVMAMILSSKKNDKPYHVKNTNIHQTYRGVHTDQVLKQAVEQTKGVFLSYNDKPITAMFDSCCGGIIPAYIHGVDFKKAPYLARSYACNFCKNCKIFNWKAEYDAYTFAQLLTSVHKNIGRVKNIKIIKKDKAGLVQEVQINGTKATIVISLKKLYSCLKEVKSFCFSVACKANKIIFNGTGYGHHVGLCQWGAREMVRQGWDYKSILQFYYPGTSFMRLS